MIVYTELLEEIASEGKHTFISTGMTTYEDIQVAINIFNKARCPFELMHTVSTYPMKDVDANLKMINTAESSQNTAESSRELLGLDKVNHVEHVAIAVASPESIRSWSKGEVKNPETINYRTFKPEKGGLFCERIFGPVKDWECSCGKYKRIKHRGVVCDRCGVEVTQARVRRERMGHIELSVPVTHIWFFKCMPSRIGLVMDVTARNLERVIYYEDYLVVDPGDTPLEKNQLLTEAEFRDAKETYGPEAFVAKIGAEGVHDALVAIDLDESIERLQFGMTQTRSKQIRKKLATFE